MKQFIIGVCRSLGIARAPQKPGGAQMNETIENFFERLRGSALKELQRQREHPKTASRLGGDKKPAPEASAG